MSAPTTEVEAAQPAAVAETTTQETIKQEDTASADAQIKQEESASQAEETTAAAESSADVKTEDVKEAESETKTEGEAEVKKEESSSKPAPLLKTKAQLNKDVSNKKYDASVLPVTDDPKVIRTQVCTLPPRDMCRDSG